MKDNYLSPILRIFYGNKVPCESVSMTAEYFEVLDELIKYDNLLIEKLSQTKEVLNLFEDFKNCREKLTAIDVECNYRDGFKFGLQLGEEIFKND